jgi:hypothetical protein
VGLEFIAPRTTLVYAQDMTRPGTGPLRRGGRPPVETARVGPPKPRLRPVKLRSHCGDCRNCRPAARIDHRRLCLLSLPKVGLELTLQGDVVLHASSEPL